MAVAHDTSLNTAMTGTTNPFTYTYTPSGTPRGIIVMAIHGVASTDYLSGMTYGGVAMTRVVRATDTVGEPGAAEIWFLGSGIPTGAQTVSVVTGATTTDIEFVTCSVTATGDTVAQASGSVSEDAANPAVALAYGGKTCMGYAAVYSGLSSGTSWDAGATALGGGQWSGPTAYRWDAARRTSAGTTDVTFTLTASLDDVAMVAIAVRELTLFTSSLSASLSFSGSISRTPAKSLTAALSFSGSLARRLARSLTAAVSFSGSLSSSWVVAVLLSAGLSFAGSLAKMPAKALTASVSFSGSLVVLGIIADIKGLAVSLLSLIHNAASSHAAANSAATSDVATGDASSGDS